MNPHISNPVSKILYLMNPADLLRKFGNAELTLKEEAELIRELSEAYQMHEAAATDSDVQGIAEKTRKLMDADGDANVA